MSRQSQRDRIGDLPPPHPHAHTHTHAPPPPRRRRDRQTERRSATSPLSTTLARLTASSILAFWCRAMPPAQTAAAAAKRSTCMCGDRRALFPTSKNYITVLGKKTRTGHKRKGGRSIFNAWQPVAVGCVGLWPARGRTVRILDVRRGRHRGRLRGGPQQLLPPASDRGAWRLDFGRVRDRLASVRLDGMDHTFIYRCACGDLCVLRLSRGERSRSVVRCTRRETHPADRARASPTPTCGAHTTHTVPTVTVLTPKCNARWGVRVNTRVILPKPLFRPHDPALDPHKYSLASKAVCQSRH